MSRKKKGPPEGPSNAYLMSFGDTMTALLAFFIVLNSLAQEQTGANLYSGTGSFVSAISSLGLPGNLSTEGSSNAVQLEHPTPYYLNEQNEGEETNGIRVLDREKDQFQRLLNELERFYDVDKLPAAKASVVFDVFQKLKKGDKPLNTNGRRLLNRTRPMLARPNYEVEVVLWTPTPAPSAWSRTFKTAKKLTAQFIEEAGLTADSQKRFGVSARPWLFSDAKRPVMSVIVYNRQTEE